MGTGEGAAAGLLSMTCQGGCGARVEAPVIFCPGCVIRLPEPLAVAVVQATEVHRAAVERLAHVALHARRWFDGHQWPWAAETTISQATIREIQAEVRQAYREAQR